jgi:hypothetical protein
VTTCFEGSGIKLFDARIHFYKPRLVVSLFTLEEKIEENNIT